jgi:hypothetical protein
LESGFLFKASADFFNIFNLSVLNPRRLPVPPSQRFEESNSYEDHAADFWQFVHDSFISAPPRC